MGKKEKAKTVGRTVESSTPQNDIEEMDSTSVDTISEHLSSIHLRKQRELISTLTRTERILPDILQSPQRDAKCQVKFSQLAEWWSNFEANVFLLQEEKQISCGEADSLLMSYETRYLDLMASLQPSSNFRKSDQSQSTPSFCQSHVQLPVLTLPTFGGDRLCYQSFISQFKSSIDSNVQLTPTQKLVYLKKSLKYEAYELISHLDQTDRNYAIALEILEKTYYNPRIISDLHVKALLNLTPVTSATSANLKVFINEFYKNIKQLQNIHGDISNSNFLLIPLLVSKLDSKTRVAWESMLNKTSKPTVEGLEEFLRHRSEVLTTETDDSKKANRYDSAKALPTYSGQRKTVSLKGPISLPTHSSMFENSADPKKAPQISLPCHVCKGNHKVFSCPNLLALSASDRLETVKKFKLCLNCLAFGHFSLKCQSPYKCHRCKLRHHTILHDDTKFAAEKSIPEKSVPVCKTHSVDHANVLMATAVVELVAPSGSSIKVRCLLDSGSMENLISERACQALKLSRVNIRSSLQCISSLSLPVKFKVQVVMRSLVSEFLADLNCLVLPRITGNLPLKSFDSKLISLPADKLLADPTFSTSNSIDLLLGSEVFFSVLQSHKIALSPSLFMQKTLLGWILAGQTPSSHSDSDSSLVLHAAPSVSSIDRTLSQFWDLEPCPSASITSTEDLQVDEFYKSTTVRTVEGRYAVRLPFKFTPDKLGSSYNQAVSRFYSLERRLANEPHLKTQYQEFMAEYKQLGHMAIVPPLEVSKLMMNPHFFMSHHAIIRESSLTTKLRVVFNASMNSSNGKSLNSLLHSGPQLQANIFDLLTQFRFHKFGLIADIKQMYRQVLVCPQDSVFQLIVWRNNPSDPLEVFRLTTVTYGTASAPYLAQRTLKQLAMDGGKKYPIASQALSSNFYVDDLLGGGNSLEDLLKLYTQLNELLSTAGMTLRKWFSNCNEFMNKLNQEAIGDNYCIQLKEDQTIKTLGVQWVPADDSFSFTVSFPQRSTHTKRLVLSDISRIYDPLGLLGPILMACKLFVRSLWMQSVDWDTPLAPESVKAWQDILHSAQLVPDLVVPRTFSHEANLSYELHGFSDASGDGYGGVVYLKTRNHDGEVSVVLLASKSRVAPLKTQTVPRLELCGALLLSNLVSLIRKSIPSSIQYNVFLWSDSTIVLYWINSLPYQLETFVANRVRQIQETSDPAWWRHVRSEHNPADCLSRGTLVPPLLWFQGPAFLYSGLLPGPFVKANNSEDIPDVKECSFVGHVSVSEDKPFKALGLSNISSFPKLIRVVCYVTRYLSKLRKTYKADSKSLTLNELREAEMLVVKIVQKEMFSHEIALFQNNKPLPSTSNYIKLAPFLDDKKVLRVGGRLLNSNLPCSVKHPIMLLASHTFTISMLKHYHRVQLHCGPQSLLYSVRQKYWPIKGLSKCKLVVKSCMTCFKNSPKPFSYPMGSLPTSRVCPLQLFVNTGLDFAGPFLIRSSPLRKASIIKAYICIFVCMATKACHVEVVLDLTSEAFIACLRRFVARRGLPSCLLCDNGRNFVGAKRLLAEFASHLANSDTQTAINKALSTTFEWKFIPVHAPSFGGLWEAAVKSFKQIFYKITNSYSLTLPEFYTITAQIEAQLNSRPLTPLSDDPHDLEALSPGHFLIGRPLNALSEDPAASSEVINYRKRWQRVQSLHLQFWHRWSKEYINSLQLKTKSKSLICQVAVGQLVLIKQLQMSPLKWPLARVVKLHPGTDSIVRVVTVKSASGESNQAIINLCPLPSEGV